MNALNVLQALLKGVVALLLWTLYSLAAIICVGIWLAPLAHAAETNCPAVYTLKVNVWGHDAFELSGVERTHAREALQEVFVGKPHVSRTHGGDFREAYSAGQLRRSTTERHFRVSFIMTPEARGGSPTITSEHIIRDITVVGQLPLLFDRSDLEHWDAIRVVAMDSGVVSPPQYHLTGFHEIRFFNRLPDTVLGEWDNNPAPDCIMNIHLVE